MRARENHPRAELTRGIAPGIAELPSGEQTGSLHGTHDGVPDGCPARIFLLSPANLTGIRAKLILGPAVRFELAGRLHQDGVPLGELFSFISGLYFRGKLAYARAFAKVRDGIPSVYVITTCQGLVRPERLVTVRELREMLTVPVEPADARYREPLQRDAQRIYEAAGQSCEIVLLGSIATPKYVEPLFNVLGHRLVFPAEFVGRGDMSRGGLMLRCVREEIQLTYVPVATAVRRGRRAAKLADLVRTSAFRSSQASPFTTST